jgi:hypothetical protein
MEQLNIAATPDSPAINFDPNIGHFVIEGRSYPEDTIDLYLPVVDWLEEYSNNPLPKTTMKFSLDYFNSSSYKALLNILLKLEKAHGGAIQVSIEWHFRGKDRDMKEAGEEFSELVDLPFTFIER